MCVCVSEKKMKYKRKMKKSCQIKFVQHKKMITPKCHIFMTFRRTFLFFSNERKLFLILYIKFHNSSFITLLVLFITFAICLKIKFYLTRRHLYECYRKTKKTNEKRQIYSIFHYISVKEETRKLSNGRMGLFVCCV